MIDPDDIKFMRRCIDLATNSEGLTYPNPMVGSVIVHEGRIIGEGYHLKAGGPHAEVNAINSVTEQAKLKHSTLYVNLEPCSHTGKTPPCADLIIDKLIPRVVIGTIDTSEKVSGEGIKRLRAAGCEVLSGVLEDDCRMINRRFFTYHEKKRPYISLKWAQSADGFIDILRDEGQKAEPNWITGKPERILVHKWRASEQSILVGAGTVKADNPRLNVREWQGPDPVRIVLSGSGSINRESAFLNSEGRQIVFTSNTEANLPRASIVKLDTNTMTSRQVADYLYTEGIQSLFIEGGAKVLSHFISCGLWDEARIFTGRIFFKCGVKAPLLHGILSSQTTFSGSSLEVYLNENERN